MARSDDLVPLLSPQKSVGLGFRQGRVVFWDPETAENVILVGGALMENLPILNTSEAALLTEDDVVSVLTGGPTWGILGRMTIPGTPEAVSALSSLRTASNTVTALESVTSLTFTDPVTAPGPEVSIAVGPSGRLLVLISAEISAQSIKNGGNTMDAGGTVGFVLSGANTLAASQVRALRISVGVTVNDAATNHNAGVTGAVTKAVLLEGLNPGTTTVTAKYARLGNGVAANIENRNITALAL
jgi:hypothetical protein